MKETVHSPAHYGGRENEHEAIKCMAAHGLESDALAWNSAKYVLRAYKKGDPAENFAKASWYALRRVAILEGRDPNYYNDAVLAAGKGFDWGPGGEVSPEVAAEPVVMEIVRPHPSDRGLCVVCKLAIEAERNAKNEEMCASCAALYYRDDDGAICRAEREEPEGRCGRCFKPTGNEFLHDCAGKLLPATWYVENLERGERILSKHVGSLKAQILTMSNQLDNVVPIEQGWTCVRCHGTHVYCIDCGDSNCVCPDHSRGQRLRCDHRDGGLKPVDPLADEPTDPSELPTGPGPA